MRKGSFCCDLATAKRRRARSTPNIQFVGVEEEGHALYAGCRRRFDGHGALQWFVSVSPRFLFRYGAMMRCQLCTLSIIWHCEITVTIQSHKRSEGSSPNVTVAYRASSLLQLFDQHPPPNCSPDDVQETILALYKS